MAEDKVIKGEQKFIRNYWEARTVALKDTPNRTLILKLYGGQSVTIKNINATDKDCYIGSDRLVSASDCYLLEPGETMTLRLPDSFGITEYIEVWCLPKSNSYKVCYFMLIDKNPHTEAGG